MTRLRLAEAATRTPSLDDLKVGPPTLDVPLACRVLGISRAHGYGLLQRDAFPAKTLKIGNTRRVVAADLVRLLSAEGHEAAA